jgi:hypothetical protein
MGARVMPNPRLLSNTAVTDPRNPPAQVLQSQTFQSLTTKSSTYEKPIMESTDKAVWPDLSKDRAALEQARQELGPEADVHALLARSQRIKDGA